jgi:Zn-finger nucleic acid-binding protein
VGTFAPGTKVRCQGWWFDASELERVLEFLRTGGLERARTLAHERQREELRRQEQRVSQLQERALGKQQAPRSQGPLEQLVDLVLYG